MTASSPSVHTTYAATRIADHSAEVLAVLRLHLNVAEASHRGERRATVSRPGKCQLVTTITIGPVAAAVVASA